MAMSHSVHGKKVIVNVGLMLLKEIIFVSGEMKEISVVTKKKPLGVFYRETIKSLID